MKCVCVLLTIVSLCECMYDRDEHLNSLCFLYMIIIGADGCPEKTVASDVPIRTSD